MVVLADERFTAERIAGNRESFFDSGREAIAGFIALHERHFGRVAARAGARPWLRGWAAEPSAG